MLSAKTTSSQWSWNKTIFSGSGQISYKKLSVTNLAEWLGPSMVVSPPPEEAASALGGVELLFAGTQLGSRQLIGFWFVGDYAFLHLLIVPAYPVHLPRADHPIVQGVDHVENIPLAKAHFALLGLLVVEVNPEKLYTHSTIYLNVT
jgi:hypothetical protein